MHSPLVSLLYHDYVGQLAWVKYLCDSTCLFHLLNFLYHRIYMFGCVPSSPLLHWTSLGYDVQLIFDVTWVNFWHLVWSPCEDFDFWFLLLRTQ